jgi:hypothetical protein
MPLKISSLNILGRKPSKLEKQVADLEQRQNALATQSRWQYEHQLQEQKDRFEEELKRKLDAQQANALRIQQQLESERKERAESDRKEQHLRDEEKKRVEAERFRLHKLHQERERKEREARAREEERRDRKMVRLRMTTPEALRSLRELIRRKYELDMAIWADRKVRRPDRPFVVANMDQADAVLEEILMIVQTWGEDNKDNTWKDHEWPLAHEVFSKLHEDGKRWWRDNPPWEEA